MNLNVKQQEFIDRVFAGESIFLTGKAGTGKSYAVREAMRLLSQEKKRVAAIAPTGIAANNINGQTIHSLFGLPPFGVLDFEACNFLQSGKRELLSKIEVVVMDEVSMLRPDVLDGMHLTLKKNGLPGLDKKQIILVGDLKQLPPILEDNTRSVLYRTYDGETFHYANIYKKIQIATIELDEVMRQDNEEFISHLNIIREGGKSEYFRQFISPVPNGIVLAPYNTTVQHYNQKGLAEQKGDEFVFDAILEGDAKAADFMFEERLVVKNGCKIMYLVNSQDNPLRNGTLGIFVSHKGCHFIRVGQVDYALEPVKVSKKKYVWDKVADELKLQEIGGITQYPFKLAYALSIHKAQGLTFDEVTIDLRRPCFQKGQMYVALSRVRTPEGLKIIV